MNVPSPETLGGFHPLAPPARHLANGVFVGVLVLTAALERLQFQLRATEHSYWWASNGRDVINSFALLTMAFGLHGLGFNGPVALLLAALLLVTQTALQPSLEGFRFAAGLSAALSLVLGAPVLFIPEKVARLLELAVASLFP